VQVSVVAEAPVVPEGPAEGGSVDRVEARRHKGDGHLKEQGDEDHGRLGHAVHTVVVIVQRLWGTIPGIAHGPDHGDAQQQPRGGYGRPCDDDMDGYGQAGE